MNKTFALTGLAILCISGQAMGNAIHRVLERGPAFTKHEIQFETVLPNGTIETNVSTFTEIGDCLNYRDLDGSYKESKPIIEVVGNDAVLRQGPLKAKWPSNLKSPQGIEIDADGKKFVVSVAGLAYTEATTGRSVLLASTVESFAQVDLDGKQIIYPNAFSDGINASVRFVVEDSGTLHQDILIFSQLPSPAEWNLDPEFTRLEIWTAFLEAPEPEKITKQVGLLTNSVDGAVVGVIDEELRFGNAIMPQGRAFTIGNESTPGRRVLKTWEKVDGNRRFLIEQMDYNDIKADLESLDPPEEAALNIKDRKVYTARNFPAAPRNPTKQKSVEVASISKFEKGFVADYIVNLASSLTNYTFRSGETYLLKTAITCYENTRIEANVCFKFTNATTVSRLRIKGPLEFLGEPYAPVTFTSWRDNTLGARILAGTTNLPSGYYGSQVLWLDSTNTYTIQNARIRYAEGGIRGTGPLRVTVKDTQIGNTKVAFFITRAYLKNVLVHDVDTAFNHAGAYNAHLENTTLARVTTLKTNANVYATNSIFSACPTNITSGAFNITNINPATIFTAAGSGTFYLVNDNFRNNGTTNIDAALVSSLRSKTTFPPLFFTNATLYENQELRPVIERDLFEIDCGFHYEVLDYIIGGLWVTNATLKVLPGTAIGVFGSDNDPHQSININNNGKIDLQGIFGKPVTITRYNAVQEQGNTNYFCDGQSELIASAYPMSGGSVSAEFADFTTPSYLRIFQWNSITNGIITARNSTFRGGEIYALDASVRLTNCLVEGTLYQQWFNGNSLPYSLPALVNCLFRESTVYITRATNAPVINNYFENTAVTNLGSSAHGHNAYTTNYGQILPAHPNDLVLATPIGLLAGPAGRYYQPANSPLINAGNTTADLLGFFHTTTQLSQVKETNSVVDIGLHYIALNSQGLPFDLDLDTQWDVLEDADGDGIADPGENSWQIYNSPNGLPGPLSLQLFIPRINLP